VEISAWDTLPAHVFAGDDAWFAAPYDDFAVHCYLYGVYGAHVCGGDGGIDLVVMPMPLRTFCSETKF
jgi:hypothetical protein